VLEGVSFTRTWVASHVKQPVCGLAEVTIKASNTKARELETESTSDDESSIESSIKHYNIKATADDESLFLLASFVASQIKRQRTDCTTLIKKCLLQRVNELLEGGSTSC
jgi:hypothetical protein